LLPNFLVQSAKVQPYGFVCRSWCFLPDVRRRLSAKTDSLHVARSLDPLRTVVAGETILFTLYVCAIAATGLLAGDQGHEKVPDGRNRIMTSGQTVAAVRSSSCRSRAGPAPHGQRLGDVSQRSVNPSSTLASSASWRALAFRLRRGLLAPDAPAPCSGTGLACPTDPRDPRTGGSGSSTSGAKSASTSISSNGSGASLRPLARTTGCAVGRIDL